MIARLPKADLHCHLDGSLRLSTLLEMAKEKRIFLGAEEEDGLSDIIFSNHRGTPREERVVGFDLAHAEEGHPSEVHAQACKLAHEGDLGVTVHAGEDCSSEEVKGAVDHCFVQRLGHGVSLQEDVGMREEVRKRGIALECCLSSNLEGGVVPSLERHPFPNFLKEGLLVTLNTDHRSLAKTTLTVEYEKASRLYRLNPKQLIEIARNGFDAAFLPRDEKTELIRSVSSELETLGRNS